MYIVQWPCYAFMHEAALSLLLFVLPLLLRSWYLISKVYEIILKTAVVVVIIFIINKASVSRQNKVERKIKEVIKKIEWNSLTKEVPETND